MKLSPEFSIIIPALDEEEACPALLREILATLPEERSYEIVVIDDGSTDATLERVRALGQQDARVRVLRHLRNYGQSAGLLTGARHARADWIVTIDADGQNNPSDIPEMWRIAHEQAGIDAVFGIRQARRDSWVKRLSSRFANGVRRLLLGDDTPDTGCGLKLFRKELFLHFPHFRNMHRFIPALAKRAEAQFRLMPVHHRPRNTGASHYGLQNRLWTGIVDMLGVFWLMRRPLNPKISEED